MPRLIGEQSNPAVLLISLIIAAIAVVTGLEYIDEINLIDGFDNDVPSERLRQNR
jgi:hypothetical protein